MNRPQTRPLLAVGSLALFALLSAQVACSTASPPVPKPSLSGALVPAAVAAPLSPNTPAPVLSPNPPPSAPVAAAASSSPLTSASPSRALSAPPNPPPLFPSAAGSPAASSAGHHYVIAAIGDSLTDPRSHGGGYLEYVRARCPGIEIDNFAKGGAMVAQMRRGFQQQVVESSRRYTHLVVFGGVNDLYSDLTAHRTPAKIEADLSTMYAWAKDHGVKVVALTVAPWGGFKRYFNASRAEATLEVNAWIRAEPALGKVDSVVDAYALLSCGDPDVLCERFFSPFRDGIHFGPAGHQILGQALFQAAFADCE